MQTAVRHVCYKTISVNVTQQYWFGSSVLQNTVWTRLTHQLMDEHLYISVISRVRNPPQKKTSQAFETQQLKPPTEQEYMPCQPSRLFPLLAPGLLTLLFHLVYFLATSVFLPSSLSSLHDAVSVRSLRKRWNCGVSRFSITIHHREIKYAALVHRYYKIF